MLTQNNTINFYLTWMEGISQVVLWVLKNRRKKWKTEQIFTRSTTEFSRQLDQTKQSRSAAHTQTPVVFFLSVFEHLNSSKRSPDLL